MPKEKFKKSKAKIKAVSPDTKVKVIDAMKTIGRVYDKTVCDGYHFMATKIPKVYGKFYKITDRRTLMYKAVMQSNTMMSAKLLDTMNTSPTQLLCVIRLLQQ